MISDCPFCGTPREPVGTPREFKDCLVARYRCPECKLRWLTGWDAASLGEAAA